MSCNEGAILPNVWTRMTRTTIRAHIHLVKAITGMLQNRRNFYYSCYMLHLWELESMTSCSSHDVCLFTSSCGHMLEISLSSFCGGEGWVCDFGPLHHSCAHLIDLQQVPGLLDDRVNMWRLRGNMWKERGERALRVQAMFRGKKPVPFESNFWYWYIFCNMLLLLLIFLLHKWPGNCLFILGASAQGSFIGQSMKRILE